MVPRNEYLPGVPCWVDVTAPDPEAATRFYGHVFGWQFEDRTPAGAGAYLVAQLDGHDVAGVGSLAGGSALTPAWSTYVAVVDAVDVARRVREAGGAVLAGPLDVPGAGRMAVCADPAGAVFDLWQADGRPGAQVVNAPGTWNWSDLATVDPDGAREFYGSVFGWKVQSVDMGSAQASMWCVPGYGDFLATLDPDLRRRHAEDGVPEGFSDAIGWLTTATGDDTTSAWTVTFAADDTDAVVERAVEAGGQVIVPPYDAGVARVAVLADPHGATFTVSHYDPTAADSGEDG